MLPVSDFRKGEQPRSTFYFLKYDPKQKRWIRNGWVVNATVIDVWGAEGDQLDERRRLQEAGTLPRELDLKAHGGVSSYLYQLLAPAREKAYNDRLYAEP